ncbi:MAG: aminopeptidase, partial [Puniceicoccales bacterium]|nr:aminopeptidase [Puniceicoccales bacterium]
MDERYEKLADVLVQFSTTVRPGDRVLVDASAVPDEIVLAVMRSVKRSGGHPFVNISRARVKREFLLHGTEDDFALMSDWEAAKFRSMQCCILLRGMNNSFEMGDVP